MLFVLSCVFMVAGAWLLVWEHTWPRRKVVRLILGVATFCFGLLLLGLAASG